MNSVEISFLIPEETVRLERQRNPETMSEDNFLWCFGGSLAFIEADSRKTLLSLREVSLLGLLSDLSQIASGLVEAGEREVVDREGTYSIVFATSGESVEVRDEWSDQTFACHPRQIIDALCRFADDLSKALLKLFPELGRNENFAKFINKIRIRLSTVRFH